jgi:cupin fold WbuC family metalloprotein
MRVITMPDIDDLILQAKKMERKRTIFRLHQHEETVQRMINAIVPGSYVTPHKHENPDKVELFNILKGRVAVLHFNDRGDIEAMHLLEDRGLKRVVEIPPRIYHTIIALEPSALFEIIQGPYNANTHKQFAPWAPLEDTPRARDYLMYLEAIVHNWK